MGWYWIRIREGLRWLFRGTNFTKLKLDIEKMAHPLAHNDSSTNLSKLRSRIEYALTWLPEKEAEPFHDMMARIGHSTRS